MLGFVVLLAMSPPEIVTVDDVTWKIAARTALPAAPAAIAMPAERDLLYVLVNGATNADGSLPNGPSRLVAFHIPNRAVTATIDAGWSASRLVMNRESTVAVCLRDRPVQRVFERPPSIAKAAIALASQATSARRPYALTAIRIGEHSTLWRHEMSRQDHPALYWVSPLLFVVPESNDGLKIIDDQGVALYVGLPPPKGTRKVVVAPRCCWVYVLEDGKDADEKSQRINGRVHVVDARTCRLLITVETEPERLSATDGPVPDGIGIVSAGGLLRAFQGSTLLWSHQAGRGFQFAQRLERGLLLAGRQHVSWLSGDGTGTPQWITPQKISHSIDPETIVLPNSNGVLLPVINTNNGWNLDRVHLLNVEKGQITADIAVGRRGRMVAKSLGLAATEGAGRGVGPQSLSWNGFALSVADTVSRSLRALAPMNLQLTVSSDGRFGYGLSRFGNDLTIFTTEDGTIVEKLPVGGGSQGLLAGEGLLCVWTTKRLIWVDTSWNAVKSMERPCHGTFDRVQPDLEHHRIITYSEHCAMFWDSRTGKLLGTVEGLGKPRLSLAVSR